MAKEKIKQWCLLIVVATGLLTALSACGVSKSSKVAYDLSHNNLRLPTYIRDRHELIYVDGQSCPDELWGKWSEKGLDVKKMALSHKTDKSGVQIIAIRTNSGFPWFLKAKETFIVDGKIHPARIQGRQYLFKGEKSAATAYAASCNFKLKDSKYKVFRVLRSFHLGVSVNDYIVGKLRGVSILGDRHTFVPNSRDLDLKNSLSVSTALFSWHTKDSQ